MLYWYIIEEIVQKLGGWAKSSSLVIQTSLKHLATRNLSDLNILKLHFRLTQQVSNVGISKLISVQLQNLSFEQAKA